MGMGVFLLVVGAILTFAIDDDVPSIRLWVTGIIFMIAGVAVILNARRTAERTRTETERIVEDPDDPTKPQVIERTFRERNND
ncbi:MAG: DUF6458 family protein [Nocardioidaceae bacterium]